MEKLRKYGTPPFAVAVVHGGPGAPGEMAPVARELAAGGRGILEPLQSATMLDGQVAELAAVLKCHGSLPLTLIGHSWGAWLSFILAAHYPDRVKKLVLVGSGPYEARYVPLIHETRMSRLTEEERRQSEACLAALGDPGAAGKQERMKQFGRLMSRADSYDPLPPAGEELEMQPEVFEKVLGEALELRASGALLRLGARIACPVVAIHGSYDPHPFAGVRQPLEGVLRDARWFLLPDCGHSPWLERKAKTRFYEILERELE